MVSIVDIHQYDLDYLIQYSIYYDNVESIIESFFNMATVHHVLYQYDPDYLFIFVLTH